MNKITKTITLKPLKTGISTFTGEPYYEQVIAYMEDQYPFAMFHIDNLFVAEHRGDNEIYSELNNGRSVTCKVTFDASHDKNYS